MAGNSGQRSAHSVTKAPEQSDDEVKKYLNENYRGLAEELGKLPEYTDPRDAVEPDDEISMRQEFFIQVFIACMGNVAMAARIAKVNPRTVWRWFKDQNFIDHLNDCKLMWELRLHARAMEIACNGNATLLIFLLKFLNPFYDDSFRTRALSEVVSENVYERHPIPRPEFLPPEIPERFISAGADADEGGRSDPEDV